MFSFPGALTQRVGLCNIPQNTHRTLSQLAVVFTTLQGKGEFQSEMTPNGTLHIPSRLNLCRTRITRTVRMTTGGQGSCKGTGATLATFHQPREQVPKPSQPRQHQHLLEMNSELCIIPRDFMYLP